MSAPDLCINCRFFWQLESKAFPTTDGVCRRYAPTGPAISSGGGWSVFPPMMAWHWCGDHRPVCGPVAAFSRVAA